MPEPAPKISALIVAKDEAANLADCLASLAWADETIVVVDASSQDETESMARSLASRVRVRPFDDFARQRNASLELATGDWVFAVDADERATPELAAEIRRALNDPANPHAGFRVPIRSVVLGRSFGYSGTQHDIPLRLFRRDRGRWIGTVHETVELKGSAGQLESFLTHRTIADMQTFLRKIDHYTTLEALKFHREGRPFRLIDLTIRPVWTFFKLYLGKQGFRDGLEGLAFCALSGLSVAVRHWKLREFYLPPSPLVGEGRAGGARQDDRGLKTSDSIVAGGAMPPPTLTLAHKGGGDQRKPKGVRASIDSDRTGRAT
jgi:glycosyltransferase involved in cell wall biosynthesis